MRSLHKRTTKAAAPQALGVYFGAYRLWCRFGPNEKRMGGRVGGHLFDASYGAVSDEPVIAVATVGSVAAIPLRCHEGPHQASMGHQDGSSGKTENVYCCRTTKRKREKGEEEIVRKRATFVRCSDPVSSGKSQEIQTLASSCNLLASHQGAHHRSSPVKKRLSHSPKPPNSRLMQLLFDFIYHNRNVRSTHRCESAFSFQIVVSAYHSTRSPRNRQNLFRPCCLEVQEGTPGKTKFPPLANTSSSIYRECATTVLRKLPSMVSHMLSRGTESNSHELHDSVERRCTIASTIQWR